MVDQIKNKNKIWKIIKFIRNFSKYLLFNIIYFLNKIKEDYKFIIIILEIENKI